MNLKTRFRDWRRGYADADVASLLEKLGATVVPPGGLIPLTRGEFNAWRADAYLESEHLIESTKTLEGMAWPSFKSTSTLYAHAAVQIPAPLAMQLATPRSSHPHTLGESWRRSRRTGHYRPSRCSPSRAWTLRSATAAEKK